ncbi:MAG TPA: hypothetical protein VHT91_21825 [Kofleriaceae bacterium]|jgi:hypothetical protein|nr:hypothetical protein [Kofleriaceae bacterium]
MTSLSRNTRLAYVAFLHTDRLVQTDLTFGWRQVQFALFCEYHFCEGTMLIRFDGDGALHQRLDRRLRAAIQDGRLPPPA